MRARARELKAEARGNRKKEAGEKDVLEKIAEMQEPDRRMAERLHVIFQEIAPDLTPRTWYGMPAYARGVKVLCFFQGANKFNARYATLGCTDTANLDEGEMWPVAFALKDLNLTQKPGSPHS